MTNKAKLQENNTALDGYIARVNAAKDVASNLPDAEAPAEIVLQSKTVTPSKSEQEVIADANYTALEKVTVEPIPSEYIVPSGTKSITENGTHDAREYESVDVNVPIPDGYIIPSGTLDITENGTYDVTEKASVNVNVEASGGEDVAGAIADRTVTEFINNNATNIGAYVFRDCAALKTVDVPNAKSVGTYAFYDCEALSSVNMPLVQSVGAYAFAYCNKLKSATFPSVTTLSSNALREVQYITHLDLPKLTNIPSQAFYGCRALKALILRSETMVTLANTNAFNTCYCILGTKNAGHNPNGEKIGFIYVPKALLSDDDETMDYRRATNWSADSLVTQFRAIEDYPEITGG
jgi:hypothetical protein